MAVVQIPSLMRDLTAGQARVTALGRTVREVVDALEEAYPGMRGRLCEDGRLKPEITVSVDNQVSRQGLAQRVNEGSEIRFLPEISGG
jgi:molybdopterin synthase sulfur carrier subunit